ncbi:MAG: acylphosphatase [Candidatus Nanoarchaeia archaeon]|nr:acylphosphatase [Candidatus Nanoarchaeia archaeon]MDD5740934.1 acylphosphatase [Candidatus Nanoarchaeia archaeon]
MKTLKIFVTGSVQGVYFRQFVNKKANELKLKGFVRNLDDGRVEVVVEGRDERVNEMVEACKKGAPQANVKEVQTQELSNQGFNSFKILR